MCWVSHDLYPIHLTKMARKHSLHTQHVHSISVWLCYPVISKIMLFNQLCDLDVRLCFGFVHIVVLQILVKTSLVDWFVKRNFPI